MRDEIFPSYRSKQAEIDAAWEHLERRLASLPSPLRALSTQFLQTIAVSTGSHRTYFSNPVAPPLLYMPLWLRDGLWHTTSSASKLDPQTIAHILAATMQGYIGIRLQDDVLDEPLVTNPNLLLLGNTFFSGMIIELSRVMGRDAESLWPALDRAIVDFSHLTLAEREQVLKDEPYTLETFVEHADKVAFARIPLLAIAVLVGRMDLEDGIRALIHRLGVAYGLANDVLGWLRDVRSGQRTKLLAQAGFTRQTWSLLHSIPEGAQRDAAITTYLNDLRAQLYDKRLLRDAIAQAIAEHRQAQELARGIGLVGFDDFTDERIAWLERLDRQTMLMTLQRVLLANPGR